MNPWIRTEQLLGKEGLERLQNARVAVFGIGGVGSYAAEALARSGVGALDLFDADDVAPSNLNRQLVALHSTIGEQKVAVMARRVADINPQCIVRPVPLFYDRASADSVELTVYDYVVDAIDTVSAKIELIVRCKASEVPVISAMGAGNKLNPAAFEVADLSKTSVCPLARVMRRELKSRGIEHLPVVYSKEPPRPLLYEEGEQKGTAGRQAPGSVSFVPGVMGLILAGEVIKAISGV